MPSFAAQLRAAWSMDDSVAHRTSLRPSSG
jgi:hypothetical protein